MNDHDLVELTLPKLGPEMDSARLVQWLVADGAVVTRGQPVLVLETDKLSTDVESPAGGVLSIVARAGDEYPVGARLATIRAAGASASPPAPLPAPAPALPASAPARVDRDAIVERRRGEPSATPAARRRARELGVALASVKPRGRVIRVPDVEATPRDRVAAPTVAEVQRIAPAPPPAPAPATELTPMRRRIADRMHASLAETAQITDVREQDVTELVALWRAGQRWAGPLGFRVTLTDLLVRATALALAAVPELNASVVDGRALVRHASVDLGVAVALPDGLIVPVLRGAEGLALGAIHRRLDDLVTRARAGRLAHEDLAGGTFTLTNIGAYGSHHATPILVPGQLGILATGAVLERPLVRDGKVVVGSVMHTSLTIDHRLIDGRTAGAFQSALGELLGAPTRLLEKP